MPACLLDSAGAAVLVHCQPECAAAATTKMKGAAALCGDDTQQGGAGWADLRPTTSLNIQFPTYTIIWFPPHALPSTPAQHGTRCMHLADCKLLPLVLKCFILF